MNIENEIPKDIDIIIIGGGMTGAGTAYFLAKEGFKVLLIEQRSIASGATGRNGSCLMQVDGRTFTKERVEKRLPFVWADVELLKELETELDEDIGLQLFGSADLAKSDEEAELLLKVTNIQKAAGDNKVDFLYRDNLKELFPALGDNVIGGKYIKEDGCINPISYSWACALKAYKDYKAKFLLHTKVEEIIIKGGKALGVKTDKGEIRANKWIINCTNAWSYFLEPNIPVFPVNNVTSVTEQVPLGEIISWESTYKGSYGYGTQQKSGNLILGSLPTYMPDSVLGHFDESVHYDDLVKHASILETQFPFMKGVSILRIFTGVFCMTPDRLPYIGPMPDIENYFINTGYSNGMAYCPIGSKLTAEYISNNGKTSLPLDLVNPNRFYGKKFKLPQKYNYTILEELLDDWDL